MRDYRLSTVADEQIEEVLARSEEMWGEQARQRYAALLATAMSDVSDNLRNPLIDWRRIGRSEVGVYHIEHSRNRVPNPPGPVGEPRHLIVFRIGKDGILDILGVMHERMLPRRMLRRILKRNATDQ